MVQNYTTDCENANVNKIKVGLKTSIKGETPVFSSDCDIRQIYKIIAQGTPQTANNSTLLSTAATFTELRKYSDLYYHTLDNNPHPTAPKSAANLKKQYIQPLKEKLPCIIWSANTLKHTTAAVSEAFNGIIQTDIDFHYWKGDQDAERLKDQLTADPYVLGAFISPSGYGLKIQIHTNNGADQYQATRDAFNKYLTDKHGIQPTVIKYGRSCKVIDVLPIAQTCYLSFDPDIYTNLSAEAFNEIYAAQRPQIQRTAAVNVPQSEAREIIENIIDQVQRQQIDITASYERWYRIGLAIAHHFGEPGRTYFHDISKYNPEYKGTATDQQYNSYLRAETPAAPVTIATVIKYAQDAGIKVKTKRIEVVNPDQVIKVKKYVSEAAPDILQTIQSHEKICIVAATGSGKTTAFFEKILPHLEGKSIVALPYVANVKQAEQRFTCGALYGSLDFMDYATAYDNKIIATTYDQATRLPGDSLIIDEAHNLPGQYDFRPEAIRAIEQAQRDKQRVILITATPSPMFQMEGFHVLQIDTTEKHTQHLKIRPYSNKKKQADIIYHEAQKAIRSDEKALIKCNNIKLLKTVCEKLIKQYPDKYISVLHSDNDNSENKAATAIQEGRFSFDILLCTSIINDGVSIDETFVHRVISVENTYSPSPKNLVQFIARPRQGIDRVKYTCYYLQAKQPKQRKTAKVTQIYNELINAAASRCNAINATVQQGEDPTDGDNLTRIEGYGSQVTLNNETGTFEPSIFAAMYEAEQLYRNTLSLEAFTATIEANYPYITIEVEKQYSIDQDKDLHQEIQKGKDMEKQQQRQIYKLINEGYQDQILEYVCKRSTDFKVIKEIQKYHGIDRRYQLSNEATELYQDNKSLFEQAYNSIERVSLRLCICGRYGIKNAENVVFNDDKIIRHGTSFNNIITGIEAHILTTCSPTDLNRLTKQQQKTILKILDTVTAIKIPVTFKQIHNKILNAVGSDHPYFKDEKRTRVFVKTFFKLNRYQNDKQKRYYTIGDRITLDEYSAKLHISTNYRCMQGDVFKKLIISNKTLTPKSLYKKKNSFTCTISKNITVSSPTEVYT